MSRDPDSAQIYNLDSYESRLKTPYCYTMSTYLMSHDS